MKSTRTLALFATSGIAAIGLAASAAAQTPLYFDLPSGTSATGVAIVGSEAVVVGTDNTGVFKWTLSGGIVHLGETTSTNPRISDDGSRVTATTTVGGISRAAYWSGGTTWTQIPGLASISGSMETSANGLSGDGSTIVGLGWATPGAGHCFSWTSAGGTIDRGGQFSDPSSNGYSTNGNGSVIVGWKNSLANQRTAARWVNGTLSFLSYVAPNMTTYSLSEAQNTNASGSIVVGYRVWGGDNSAWRWDASTGNGTLLPNLPGETTSAAALDVSDDGSIIVGHSGGNVIGGTHSIIWINNQPQGLGDYLVAHNTPNFPSYPDIGLVTAISGDGNAIVGRGTGFGSGQPTGGWLVLLNGALSVGTSFCSGDGSGTACPCANSGVANHGCASSINAQGARLSGSGTASISADSLDLKGEGMPNSSALYFQGTTQVGSGAGSAFGDGLRCAGGSIVRLKAVTNVAGLSHYPGSGNPSVSVKGAITTPGVRTYQVWYRNAAAFCTPSTFNLTNGLEITWGA